MPDRLSSDRPDTASAAPLNNRLAEESSPYLLQHKDNPVAWQPWGPEAFEEARRSNKPVLLSVGYAACHWCHVMAHESFENPAIAELMNKLFVNIKVDREERPDVDSIYQQAVALLGVPGGWPLTMFLTPSGAPFWGGTYFPPQPSYGRPGFPQILARVVEVYASDPDGIAKNVAALTTALHDLSRNSRGDRPAPEFADQLAQRLVQNVDQAHGGIGYAPKFPQTAALEILWRAWKRSGMEPCRQAVDLTLTKMCQGGIYDHLGGGFARYSVDNQWLVPHFEKMLYDNALLVDLLTWAWQDSGNPLYEHRVRETVGWVLGEMMADSDGTGQTPAAGFASSLDADSEGEEGKFYVWTEAEIDDLLGPNSDLFKRTYDVTPGGNWEGKTILNRSHESGVGEADEEPELARLRTTLLAARAKRVRPGWDDKVLADWNGLMIAALARAAAVFGEDRWLAAAEAAFSFITEQMTDEGRLKHAWRHGRLRHPATLDDYAHMSEAALRLAEVTGRDSYLSRAEAWAAVVDGHYWDPVAGGYFLSADDTEQLIVRSKSAYDNATPSGNGVMAGALARLYYLTGKTAYRERAEAVIAAFSGDIERNTLALATLINSNELLHHAVQIVILGEPDAADTQALLDVINGLCLPNRVLQQHQPGSDLPGSHPAAGKPLVNGQATAYVCRGQTCSLPLTEPEALALALKV